MKLLKKVDMTDVIVLVGICLITYGTYEIYRPAAFLVAGFLLLSIGYLSARKGGG